MADLFEDNLLPGDELPDENLTVSQEAPAVSTDKPDYAPGETAIITGRGFAIGSTIQVALQDDPNDPGDDGITNIYTPFSITDGVQIKDVNGNVIGGDLDGVADGNFTTTWLVPPDPDGNGPQIASAYHATLILTATGNGADSTLGTADDQTATTTFTDAGSKEAANLDQWQNGPSDNLDPNQDGWVNGNLNGSQAHYNEGEYVPYRTTLSALDPNIKYWHQFEWDTTVSSGKHALDFLGTYDASFNPLPAGEVYPNPITGGPGVGDNQTVGSATISTLDIPDDPRVLAGQDGVIGTSDDITQGPGVMTLYGGTFDGYALPGIDGIFGPTNYITGATNDLLLRTGADNVFNTVDDQLINPGADGFYGTADDITTTGGFGTNTPTQIFLNTGKSVINGVDGIFGNTDDYNPYSYTGTYAGASTASLVPVITYNGLAEGNAILAWSGHIATRANWGTNNSAAAISGSPYHMRGLDFISQNDSTVSWGNQDRSLQNNAVTYPASITVKKETTPDGSNQTFDFTLTRPVNTVDVLNGYIDLSGDRAIDGQDDGTFVDSGGETFTVVNGVITSYNGAGTVNSYFVNTSGLVVSGSTSGSVVTAVDLAGTGTVSFSLVDGGSITFDTLTDFAGYTIKEIVPANWDLTSINRVEIDEINSGDVNDTVNNPANDQTTISLTETDSWTLTFNNNLIAQAPAINLEKTVNPTSIPEGSTGPVTYTYVLTNTDPTPGVDPDPLTITNLVDDNGTTGTTTDDFKLVNNGTLVAGVT
ncbi:MAG TPA: hypothetical protein DDZ80_29325, partial [Cyanobacteria bacterium UBA8803]|nr:hypothetical protein [Cyanobacteria bacterium UBA8803]